jgi:hypothetical protein
MPKAAPYRVCSQNEDITESNAPGYGYHATDFASNLFLPMTELWIMISSDMGLNWE